MNVSDIMELESANANGIYLLKEGMFYRAYNRSAMRFCACLQAYKVNTKYIKKVKQVIYYCGFPQQSLEKVKQLATEKGYGYMEEEKRVIISGITDDDDYEKWKELQAKKDLQGFQNLEGLIKKPVQRSVSKHEQRALSVASRYAFINKASGLFVFRHFFRQKFIVFFCKL